MKNTNITVINDTTAQVTKAFMKKAVIFGTEEYKLWREFKKDFPNAQMVTKSIKKKADKKSYKNHTYNNMRLFIRTLNDKDAAEKEKEFDRQLVLSKIQKSPYKAVLAWFVETFKDNEDYNRTEIFKEEDKPTETTLHEVA